MEKGSYMCCHWKVLAYFLSVNNSIIFFYNLRDYYDRYKTAIESLGHNARTDQPHFVDWSQ